jgi:hypothetical protein
MSRDNPREIGKPNCVSPRKLRPSGPRADPAAGILNDALSWCPLTHYGVGKGVGLSAHCRPHDEKKQRGSMVFNFPENKIYLRCWNDICRAKLEAGEVCYSTDLLMYGTGGRFGGFPPLLAAKNEEGNGAPHVRSDSNAEQRDIAAQLAPLLCEPPPHRSPKKPSSEAASGNASSGARETTLGAGNDAATGDQR